MIQMLVIMTSCQTMKRAYIQIQENLCRLRHKLVEIFGRMSFLPFPVSSCHSWLQQLQQHLYVHRTPQSNMDHCLYAVGDRHYSKGSKSCFCDTKLFFLLNWSHIDQKYSFLVLNGYASDYIIINESSNFSRLREQRPTFQFWTDADTF